MASVRSANDEAASYYRAECHQLLLSLKETVERLLAMPSTNVWNIHGGLERVAKSVSSILAHRFKSHQGSQSDIWPFVRGLRWLRPISRTAIDLLERDFPSQRSQQWLHLSLLAHDLSSQLGMLVNSRQHLLQHYHVNAYLCQPDYFQALLICLRAVEQNRPALLADVNPELICRSSTSKRSVHARSASLPFVPPTKLLSHPNETTTSGPIVDQAYSSVVSDKVSGMNGAFGLYASSDTSISDISFCHDAAVEPFGDPLQNFYATSTVERQHSMAYTSSSSPENRDNFHRRGSVTACSPSSTDGSLGQSISFSTSPDIVPEHRNSTGRHHHTSFAAQLLISEREAANMNQLYSSHEHIDHRDRVRRLTYEQERAGSDSVDGSSVIADSGIGSNAPSLRQTSDVRKESVKNKGINVERQTHTANATKRISHVRSSSDIVIPMASSLDSSTISNSERVRRTTVPRGFHQPSEGQSLLSYLSSQDFHTCTDLDRHLDGQIQSAVSDLTEHLDRDMENAHFSIAEALIAAIEQMIWNQTLTPKGVTEHDMYDSDEEIQQLKHRIRVRRIECLKEMAKKFPGYCEADAEVGQLIATSTQSGSLKSFESLSQDECSSSSEEVHNTEIGETDSKETGRQLVAMRENGLSLSMASLYSDADLARGFASVSRPTEVKKLPSATESINNSGHSHMSADSIAISLLKRFSENQLPKASELVWMVSAEDAPQELLPLPASYPISPDDGENADVAGKQNRIRGNLDWAPPRAQIIFTIHQKHRQSEVLAKQNYRCAGCGSKVEQGFTKRYRYCEYFGKYFCPCCHSNDRAYIPGRILRRWDFSKYAVSHFAFDLLRRIYNDPLFSVEPTLSSGAAALYRKVKSLDQLRDFRIQLHHLSAFIQTCTRQNRPSEILRDSPSHWFTNLSSVHMYSLHELTLVKKNELLPALKGLVVKCVEHVNNCQLCRAKGFICEMCSKSDDIIFPFELARVVTCENCRTCFHKACFNPDKCPKCMRIQARKRLLQADDSRDTALDDV